MLKLNGLMKKRKGWLSAEVVIVMVIVMILMTGAIIAYPQMKDSANRTTARQDVEVIKTAIQVYMGYSKDGQPPATLQALVDGLGETDSIDLAEHRNLMDKASWQTVGDMKDPWGGPYLYDGGARTIKYGTTTGNTITISF